MSFGIHDFLFLSIPPLLFLPKVSMDPSQFSQGRVSAIRRRMEKAISTNTTSARLWLLYLRYVIVVVVGGGGGGGGGEGA